MIIRQILPNIDTVDDYIVFLNLRVGRKSSVCFFPLRYPINCATLMYGGMLTKRRM